MNAANDNAVTSIRSASVVLTQPNIDTDQIIPARFLSTTQREGLGAHAFNDWRQDAQGNANPDFPFNQAGNAARQVLLAGRNFGCGSSREHAPWALRDLGLRAVVSSQIADIFRNNALKNGLVPVILDEDVVQALMQRPDDVLEIDIAAAQLRTPAGDRHDFQLDAFAQTCLLQGVDEMGWLLGHMTDIQHFEETHHAR